VSRGQGEDTTPFKKKKESILKTKPTLRRAALIFERRGSRLSEPYTHDSTIEGRGRRVQRVQNGWESTSVRQYPTRKNKVQALRETARFHKRSGKAAKRLQPREGKE